MPIDPSISDMPWLAQGGYDSRPLAAGAAVGAHVAAQRAQNASLAERAQEFQVESDRQQQELNMKLKMFPLQQTLEQQQSQKGALQIEQLLKAKNDDLEGEKAFTGLQSVVSDGLAAKKPLVDIRADVLNYATKNQAVFLADKWKPFSANLDSLTKEADSVVAHRDANSARNFRNLPAGMKLQTMLDDANTQLADALAPETSDPVKAEHLQKTVIPGLQTQLQIEKDKIKNAADRNIETAKRTQATDRRTTAIEANTQVTMQRLGSNDKIALASKLRTVDDNSKMSFEEKLDAKDTILKEFELRAKRQVRPLPATGARTAPATAAPAAAEPAAPVAAAPATKFSPGQTYRDKYGNLREYQADGSWKALPE